jgi:hypothetical protein
MGMTGFTFSGGAKQSSHIMLAFRISLVGEIQISTVSLRLNCERGLQVLLRL